MDTAPASVAPAPSRRSASLWTHKALWLIGLGLLANAGAIVYTSAAGHPPDLVLDRAALAQGLAEGGGGGAAPLGARGIFMMPAQLGPQAYGLYLMDVDSGTLCVYRMTSDNAPRFRLIAARSFKYDRFLEDFNNDTPTPAAVQKLVEQQRQRIDIHARDQQVTVDTTTRPDENQSTTMPATTPEGGKRP